MIILTPAISRPLLASAAPHILVASASVASASRLVTSLLQQQRLRMSTASSKLPNLPTSFPIHTFEPHPTIEHPLHGATAPHAPQPAVIVLQEWWGINDTGAIAVVPDLYNGKSTVDAEEASHLMSNLDWQKALNDLESLAVALQKNPEESDVRRKVGGVGFCMGGALSLALAARMAEKKRALNAAISFYGIPSKELIDVSKIPLSTPVQAHF
ncbi:hypothetical protein HDV05_006348, partial [Chytridiales sp. JEL 0842]